MLLRNNDFLQQNMPNDAIIRPTNGIPHHIKPNNDIITARGVQYWHITAT